MKFAHPILAPAITAPVSLGFGVVWYVSNTTNPGDPQGTGTAGIPGSGRSPRAPFPTIAAAVTAAVAGRGDVIVIQRGTYTVTDLTVNRAGLTLMAAQTMGYPDHVVISGDTYVTANNCSFYNLEFFSNSATEGSVTVGMTSAGAFSEVNSAWFEDCSFASNGTIEPAYGLRVFGGNNHGIVRCRFIDNGRGLSLRSGGDSFASHVRVKDCEFLENTTYDIGTQGTVASVTGDTLGVDGGARNSIFFRNVFGRGETTPTDDINIVGTSSGMFAANRIARATNDSATSTIPAGLLWVANQTEAGNSTARPA